MKNERYVVFQHLGIREEWEQESIPMTLEEAREFKTNKQKLNPNDIYYVFANVDDSFTDLAEEVLRLRAELSRLSSWRDPIKDPPPVNVPVRGSFGYECSCFMDTSGEWKDPWPIKDVPKGWKHISEEKKCEIY